MRSKRVSYAGKKTVLIYAYLKRGAEHLLHVAESNQQGRTYTSMMSIVATAFFLEAYLNHLGSMRLPCWSLVERSLAPNEKLSLLHKHLDIKPDWGKRPYQSFKKVFNFRNIMAHGKTQTVKGKWKSTFGRTNAMTVLQTEWEKVCTPKKARQFYEDGKTIVEELHRTAGLSGPPFGTMAEANASV